MIKNIKRVGIIFLAVAIVCLMAIGCLVASKVGDTISDVNSDNVMTTADADFILQGDFTQMQDIWNNAVEESIKYNKNVKVMLGKDWVAQTDAHYTTSFGEGIGFLAGTIVIPKVANITLDLNGKTINRNLSAAIVNGNVIRQLGVLNIVDNSYNPTLVESIYNANKTNKENLINALSAINCGKITGGYDITYGGGIYVDETADLYFHSGMMIENRTTGRGGAICGGTTRTVCIIYNGLFVNNDADVDGGSIYTNGRFTINGGYFIGCDSNHGGAIYAANSYSELTVNNATLAYNTATQCGGASYSYQGKTIINNAIFYKNSAGERGGALSGTANDAHITISNCEIYENSAKYGGAISDKVETSTAIIELQGGKIYNNTATNNGGGILVGESNRIKIAGGLQVYGNTASGSSSDIHINKNSKIEILDELISTSKTTHIGIRLANDFVASTTFTQGYKHRGNDIDPNKVFFSNNTNLPMVKSGDEVALGTSGTKPTEACEWKLTPTTGNPITTTGTNMTVIYNGGDFTLTNNKATFATGGSSTMVSSYNNIHSVGTIAFYTNADVSNPVLTVTVLPKEVDVEWSNTELIYNGASQIPNATVKTSDLVAGDTCDVSVGGAQILVGNYIANITGLSNKNYKIKTTTKLYKDFTIAKANLTIDVTTKNISKEYNGKIVDIGNDWYNITTNGLLGVDRGKAIDKLFNIDTKAFVPQFNGNESAVEVGEYTISTKPFTVSEVFKDNINYNVNINYVNTGKLTINNPAVVRASAESGYDFMILQNNKRVSYKEKELIHGDNDSEYTNFVLGNIAPNTSVQTLLNNLVFSDMSQVQIYNGANEVVYGENAKAFYTANIDNGTELAVGTGWYIRYEKLTGGEETIYLSVLGDLTGDGKVNSADVNRLRQMVNNSEVYTNSNEVVKLSSLIINNGKTPTNADAEIVWNVVCGKIDIADFI